MFEHLENADLHADDSQGSSKISANVAEISTESSLCVVVVVVGRVLLLEHCWPPRGSIHSGLPFSLAYLRPSRPWILCSLSEGRWKGRGYISICCWKPASFPPQQFAHPDSVHMFGSSKPSASFSGGLQFVALAYQSDLLTQWILLLLLLWASYHRQSMS